MQGPCVAKEQGLFEEMKDPYVPRGQKQREKETQDEVVKLGRGQSYKISVSTQNQFALTEWEGIQFKRIKILCGTSLVVQQLKLYSVFPVQGTQVQQGTRKSFHATTKDPMCCK